MRAFLLLFCCLLTMPLGAFAQSSGAGLVLMGPPGAGKGTQAAFLKERYHLRAVSPGELLREQVRAGTPLGKQVESTMNSGKLVPDEIIFTLLATELDSLSPEEGFLLDGFPRSQAQAEQLDKLLVERRRSIGVVVLLNLQDEQILHRLSQRSICPTCQRSYHLTDNPPRAEGLCDDDLTALIQRPDDRPEVIQKRLAVYHESTAPVAGYYRLKKLLREVDAGASIDTVRARLIELLDPLLAAPALK